MVKSSDLLISAVVPVYNESAGLKAFHELLLKNIKAASGDSYEIIYCDDGSTDGTSNIIRKLKDKNPKVRMLKLSRNFGKEVATTAGIHNACGQAIITLDADGQHPPELIEELVKLWQRGAKVVVGIRTTNDKEGYVKRWGSKMFYGSFSRLTRMKLLPNSTDFRLIDRVVQQQFAKMTERNRITRGLIDWLGYPRDYIEFKAPARTAGGAGYSFKKLVKLAIDSMISLSLSPLYITAYIGAVILPISFLLGLFMAVNGLLSDPLHLHATGSAYVLVLVLFLVGILMMSQGIIGLYLSHIHTETQNRPLYIIDEDGQ